MTMAADWSTAETDPKLIRSYDHPVDGRYMLGADIAAWLRDLAAVARDGSPIAAAIHAPFLDAMAGTVDRWLTTDAEEVTR